MGSLGHLVIYGQDLSLYQSLRSETRSLSEQENTCQGRHGFSLKNPRGVCCVSPVGIAAALPQTPQTLLNRLGGKGQKQMLRLRLFKCIEIWHPLGPLVNTCTHEWYT